MARRLPGPDRDVLAAIVNESDRGCVLVSAAWMENQLRIAIESLLRAIEMHGPYRLRKDKLEKRMNAILEDCLDSAFDRIGFCRCLGMIDDRLDESLRTLFHLRNRHFGHFAGTSRLTDREVRQSLDKFLVTVGAAEILTQAKFPSERRVNSRRHSKARRRFMTAVMVLAIELSQISGPLESAIRAAALADNPLPSK